MMFFFKWTSKNKKKTLTHTCLKRKKELVWICTEDQEAQEKFLSFSSRTSFEFSWQRASLSFSREWMELPFYPLIFKGFSSALPPLPCALLEARAPHAFRRSQTQKVSDRTIILLPRVRQDYLLLFHQSIKSN